MQLRAEDDGGMTVTLDSGVEIRYTAAEWRKIAEARKGKKK